MSPVDQESAGAVETFSASIAQIPESAQPISVGFVTRQGAQHARRHTTYRNEVVSLRLHASVGSAACEPGDVSDDEVFDCVGVPVAELLGHDQPAIRVAALDALLQHARPVAGTAVQIPGGSSVEKSTVRAREVVGLLPSLQPGARVAVIGVVNSLLSELTRRELAYLPCDLKGGRTEWGEQIHRDATTVISDADAVLISGMSLVNGTFDGLMAQTRAEGKPLVVFAQSGAGVFPHLLDRGVSAVSAEPWPFFWLGGERSTIVLHSATGFAS